MRINKQTPFLLLILVFGFILMSATTALTYAQDANSTTGQEALRSVPDGEVVEKFRGVVTKRSADSFLLRDANGAVTAVTLTPQTEVKSHKKGVFRGSKEYAVTNILRGLRLEVDGKGNAEGQLVADKIRFDEQDLRTAQALQVSVDPLEANAEKMSGQIAENTNIANKALASATLANNRINGLDEFEPVKTITVLFATGSGALGPKGKATIDEAAAWVKTQNTKGWVVAVVGFADTSGNTAKNRALSERRSNSVIGYLVTKHNLPLQRLVQPFGYGDSNPVADNSTDEGRAQNRRVEIRLLVNKGIAGTSSAVN
jgi:outer membrane protein OmpA-like peptidoglycan-associated protein